MFFVFSSAQLTDKQKEMLEWTNDSPANCSLHVNKAICLLSHHPFGDTFEKWLRFIYVSIKRFFFDEDLIECQSSVFFYLFLI